MDTYGDSPDQYARIILAELSKIKGAVRMEASYSGGNDEGGVDDIAIFDANGCTLLPPDRSLPKEPNQERWSYNPHPLWNATDEFLGTEFGSWGGEFSAGGTVVADLSEKRVYTRDTYYEVPIDQPGVGSLDVSL